MDPTLQQKLGADGHGVRLLDDPAGRLKLADGTEYALQPLSALWGAGRNADGPRDERVQQLELAIEAAVLEHSHRAQGLTDGAVSLAYDALARDPESDPRGDAVTARIQRQLRFFLSLNDFNRQEVRGAFRRLAKSVQKFAKAGGRTAYLDAIHGHVPHHH